MITYLPKNLTSVLKLFHCRFIRDISWWHNAQLFRVQTKVFDYIHTRWGIVIIVNLVFKLSSLIQVIWLVIAEYCSEFWDYLATICIFKDRNQISRAIKWQQNKALLHCSLYLASVFPNKSSDTFSKYLNKPGTTRQCGALDKSVETRN